MRASPSICVLAEMLYFHIVYLRHYISFPKTKECSLREAGFRKRLIIKL